MNTEPVKFVTYIPDTAKGIGTACMLINKGFIYLSQRLVSDGQGTYACPGGMVDDTDFSIEDAIRRELREETGLDIDEDRLIWLGYAKVETKKSDYTCWYIVGLKDDEIPQHMEPEKHSYWRRYRLYEALTLPLMASTREVIEYLQKVQQKTN